MMNPIENFIKKISAVQLNNCFNPYLDICPVYDQPFAPEIRKNNLYNILQSLTTSPHVDIWIGRDLGYKGGRRTGVALIDEFSLNNYAKHLHLKSLERSTLGPPAQERTATTILKILHVVDCPILTWNVFPFHPYENGNIFSNRQHTQEEAKLGLIFLEEIMNLLQIKNIIAIGNDAAKWTKKYENNYNVRHPSYGGQNDFLLQMRKIYNITQIENSQINLL